MACFPIDGEGDKDRRKRQLRKLFSWARRSLWRWRTGKSFRTWTAG